MKLADLLASFDFEQVEGVTDKEVTELVYHSDKATAGSVFFAIEGQFENGEDYIGQAVSKGAEAVVTRQKLTEEQTNLARERGASVVRVKDVRKALAHMSAELYANPSGELLVIGVTGTKGKTSVTFMIKEILEAAGIKTGIIGTVANGYQGHMTEASSTTPQSLEVQRLLRSMKDGGCKAVVMEVSSQGLMQSRAENIDFDIGVFTNITPDHIGDGEHKDFEDYLYWKSVLFKKCRRAVINADDPRWPDIIRDANPEQKVFFGERPAADFRAEDIELLTEGGKLGVTYNLSAKPPCGDGSTRRMSIGLPGRFNVQNSLAAIAVTKSLGIPWDIIDRVMENIKLPGRVESVELGKDFTILIDYAHNGTALEHLMKSLKEYKPKRIMVVFGCGGNRDKNRRYEMGRVAKEYADFIIVTSDNPRRENPQTIIEDIMEVVKDAGKPVLTIPDRREAIERAVREGQKGDIVVIAGKGHEAYQIIGTEIKHFDDREVILSLREEK